MLVLLANRYVREDVIRSVLNFVPRKSKVRLLGIKRIEMDNILMAIREWDTKKAVSLCVNRFF